MSSPRTIQRLSRILSMLPWVIANQGATVDEVCSRFGYTRAELVKDLNLVFVCGLPGYGPGDLMTAYVDEDEVVIDTADYFAEPLRLTSAEALVLLAGGMAMLSAGTGPPVLAGAVAKLQAALLPDEGAIEVDIPSEPEMVTRLRDAAAGGEVIEIVHSSVATGHETTRRIEPWGVFTTLGNWYVSGHCRLAGAERVFRVVRIRSASDTGERFDPPSERPAAEVRYTPGVDDARAVIRLQKGARWVAEYYPVELLEDSEDGLLVEFSSADPAVAARLLLRLGDQATLEEGDVVAAARDRLRNMVLARYGVTT
ncbi:MAG: WYL domain-containing protein, partial [Acidimicrobiia bacterium]|nr:WYL domain-containing protein [Acidimicrobiia bacterium]